ncbi:methyltransferase family protein [Paenibacillus sp. NPDC055715]
MKNSISPIQHDIQLFLDGPAPAQLLDINFAFTRSRILHTALELNIFEHIQQGTVHSEDLAISIGCVQKNLERLLGALTGMNLLIENNRQFKLTPVVEKYLLVDSPCYLGDHLNAVIARWNAWSGLTELIRSDKSKTVSDSFFEELSSNTFPIAFSAAWEFYNNFNVMRNSKVLHVRPGSGEWSIAMAIQNPTIDVTALGKAKALESIQKRIQQLDLISNYSFITEDFPEWEPDEKRYDLIVFSHVFRFIGPDSTKSWIDKAKSCLTENGMIMLIDTMFQSLTSSAIPSMIGMSMLVNTENGDVQSVEDYENWLKDCGLSSVTKFNANPYPTLIARR